MTELESSLTRPAKSEKAQSRLKRDEHFEDEQNAVSELYSQSLYQESLDENGNIRPHLGRLIIEKLAAVSLFLEKIQETYCISRYEFKMRCEIKVEGADSGVDVLAFNFYLLVIAAVVFVRFFLLGMEGAVFHTAVIFSQWAMLTGLRFIKKRKAL
jgi:hypothetical protein